MRPVTLKAPVLLFAAAAGILFATTPTAANAGNINGTVVNKTNGRASNGDTVTLLSLTAALEEVGKTKTDAQGHFVLTTPTEAPYLIKVEHQKGAYFKNVPPGTNQVEITVYDVATKVDGVSTEADVLRIEAENGQLKVTENYFVKNTSSPPRTEANPHGYEVVLPPDAVLEGAATVGPSNMPLAATPDPISPKGHYSFSFPIRPNEGETGTRFQMTYHLPYNGTFKFSPKLVQGSDNLAIMLPKSMKFAPGSGTSYQTVPDNVDAQTFLTREVKPGQPLDFTVSGTGSMPRESQGAAATGPGAGGPVSQAEQDSGQISGPGGKPGGGLGNPIDTADPLTKYKYWILGGLGLVLVAAAAFLIRRPGSPSLSTGNTDLALFPAPYGGPGAASRGSLLLDALKEELFAIESEKIAGTLSAGHYAELKSAFETVLRRALARNAASPSAATPAQAANHPDYESTFPR